MRWDAIGTDGGEPPSRQRRPPYKTNKGKTDEAADAAALTYSLTYLLTYFVDLPEVHNQSIKTEILANFGMVTVCRLTGYVMAIPCCKEGLTSSKAAHKKQLDKLLKVQPPSVFVAGDQVWVQNREEDPENLGRVWQGPVEIIDKISNSVYRVNHNGVEQDLSVEQLKPFVKLNDRRQPSLHYYAEPREIHDDPYVVVRVNKHEWREKWAMAVRSAPVNLLPVRTIAGMLSLEIMPARNGTPPPGFSTTSTVRG